MSPTPRTAVIWTATYFLMGIRYPVDMVTRFLEGVRNMRESSTDQALLKEGREEGRKLGRVEGGKRFLLRQGTRRFGQADAETLATFEAIQEFDRLEAIADRILDLGIQNWDDLLRTP